MNKSAVVIGIDQYQTLPRLESCRKSAELFAHWAINQGFEVALITDKEEMVTIQSIKRAVKAIVDAQRCDQLIVYFSGHGILKAPDVELWVLSACPSDPDEAVLVSKSIVDGRYNSGIRHIVFISDACRSNGLSHGLSSVNGGSIFPVREMTVVHPSDVDIFYATLPGNMAYELPMAQATSEYSSVFTDHLLNGLEGKVEEVIEQVADHSYVVPSGKLKKYLKKSVPAMLSMISLRFKQEPDIRVESEHPPIFLSRILRDAPIGVSSGDSDDPHDPSRPSDDSTKPNDSDLTCTAADSLLHGFSKALRRLYSGEYWRNDTEDIVALFKEPKAIKVSDDYFFDFVRRLLDISAYTTQFLGVRSLGDNQYSTIVVVGGGSQVHMYTEDGSIYPYEPTPFFLGYRGYVQRTKEFVLISFDFGLVVLPLLENFDCLVAVNGSEVLTVSYFPKINFGDHYMHELLGTLHELKTISVATAHMGLFRMDKEQSILFGDLFRRYKRYDPTLGLLAGYAYMNAGNIDGVNSIIRFMIDDLHFQGYDGNRTLLPDIGILSQRVLSSSLHDKQDFNLPRIPMLTAGLAFIDHERAGTPEVLIEVMKNSVPGLWTTFHPSQFERLLEVMTKTPNYLKL